MKQTEREGKREDGVTRKTQGGILTTVCEETSSK